MCSYGGIIVRVKLHRTFEIFAALRYDAPVHFLILKDEKDSQSLTAHGLTILYLVSDS